jgi:2-keto-4-pentenoate hydratase/2-oxohepta-3-ene-1,7-dioic acid hydratase in catechol pathway
MRWVTYRSPRDRQDRIGVLHGNAVHGLAEPHSLVEALRGGQDVLQLVAETALTSPEEVIPAAEVELRAPVPVPPSIRDFMAFEEHVVTSMKAIGRRVDPVWYEIPVFYFTNPAAVYGPYAPVPVSPGTAAFDYELEVAVVIGKEGSNIPVRNAADYIAGYTVLADWSARDLQEQEMAAGLGPAKGKDTGTSIGPYLVTLDELECARGPDGRLKLAMSASVNGREYSRGTTATMLSQVDATFRWGLYDRDPLPRWTHGRLTLLGDAAHPMLPHMGQGANQAIEDGMALAMLMRDTGVSDVTHVLIRYQALRRDHTARVQQGSRANGMRMDSGQAIRIGQPGVQDYDVEAEAWKS